MLSTNTNFDTKHDVDYKTPMYIVIFDGESIIYSNHKLPGSFDISGLLEDGSVFLLEDGGEMLLESYGTANCKDYLVSISGLSQKVTPEEGKASIGGIDFELINYNNEITALFATDPYFFHRRKTTIKAGYMGMDYSDMLTIMVGWVTGLSLTKDGVGYKFEITDPIKWMQRKIFRGAEDSTVVISGNPLNILLACLTSTGEGTNGDYDYYDSSWGLGLDTTYINVSAIEAVRDDWYPGDSHYMKFSIDERIKAKEFFEKEIFKPLNLYPIIDGQGRFSVKPFKPPLAALETVQTFNEDNIIGLPQWDANLSALVNEVEIFYDYDGDDFLTEVFIPYGTSINNRGPGKKPITIKSKGLHSSHSPASITGRATDILETRKNRIFGRFATPPIKIKAKTFFSRWLSEAGDVVPFTHGEMPDIVNGTQGLTATRMEMINKSVDRKRGGVNVELLDTGFNKSIYGVISPTMTILSATDGENFVVSVADATKFSTLTLPEVQICNSNMRQKKANVTLLTVNTTTGACTCDAIGFTPSAGDIVLYADYDNCTAEQKNWNFIADSGDKLGTDNDDAHLINP